MKKKFAMILALVLALASVAAFAEGSALEAFRQLTGQDTTLAQDEQAPVTFKTSEDYLDEIMAGAYATPAADQAAAASLAPALSNLSAITMQDIASYAAGHALSVAQVLSLIHISGALCKPPIYRSTPFGREICDMTLADVYKRQ